MNVDFLMFVIYQKYNKRDYINYQVISLLSTAFKFLPKAVLYNVNPYVQKIIGNSQIGFPFIYHERSHILYPSDRRGRILSRQRSVEFKKSQDSVRKVVLFNFSISLESLLNNFGWQNCDQMNLVLQFVLASIC